MERPALAIAVDVHPGSVARWETGGALPTPHYLDRISEATRVSVEWLLTGHGDVGEETPEQAAGPATEGDAEAAEALMEHVEGLVRNLGGVEGISATELRLRRLDVLEGARRILSAVGPVPSWWYELNARVEEDRFHQAPANGIGKERGRLISDPREQRGDIPEPAMRRKDPAK